MKKYEFTDEKHPSNPALRRIRALIELSGVKIGDLGGWIEKEDNLAHGGTCWVSDNACVYGNARIYGKAMVYGNARIYGKALVSGKAMVSGKTMVYDDARVRDNARISGNARVSDSARISDNAMVFDSAMVFGSAWIYGKAKIFGNALIYGKAVIESSKDYMTFSGLGSEGRFCTLFRTTNGHLLNAGCWSGTIDEFEKRVMKVYGGESDYLLMLPVLRHKTETWRSGRD